MHDALEADIERAVEDQAFLEQFFGMTLLMEALSYEAAAGIEAEAS
jgi:hypothetical protein